MMRSMLIFAIILLAMDALAAQETTPEITSTSNITNSTGRPETKEKHSAPWWVIILITLCFVHLIGGTAYATLVRYENSRLLGRFRKRERILATGQQPKSIVAVQEISYSTPIMMMTAKEATDTPKKEMKEPIESGKENPITLTAKQESSGLMKKEITTSGKTASSDRAKTISGKKEITAGKIASSETGKTGMIGGKTASSDTSKKEIAGGKTASSDKAKTGMIGGKWASAPKEPTKQAVAVVKQTTTAVSVAKKSV